MEMRQKLFYVEMLREDSWQERRMRRYIVSKVAVRSRRIRMLVGDF